MLCNATPKPLGVFLETTLEEKGKKIEMPIMPITKKMISQLITTFIQNTSIELWTSLATSWSACRDDDPDSKPCEHAPYHNVIDKILRDVGHDNAATLVTTIVRKEVVRGIWIKQLKSFKSYSIT